MANLATQTFYGNGSWTAPAGVTSVTVVSQYGNISPLSGSNAPNDPGLTVLNSAGTAYSWGLNSGGQLGDNSITTRSSPVAVVGGLKFAKVIKNNNMLGTYGITPNGLLYAWGDNAAGQLGNGTTTNSSSPVLVSSNLTFVDVATGNSSTGGGVNNGYVLGLTNGGDIWAWGDNTKGNLGDGTRTNRSSPVLVVGGRQFSRVYATVNGTSIGMTTSGSLFAWGANVNGANGTGVSTANSSPVAVVGGLTYSQVFIGQGANAAGDAVYGLQPSGSLVAWGNNSNGQLGDNTITNRSSPVAVVGGLTLSQVFPAQTFTLAFDRNGKAYGWGSNANGQLGDGSQSDRSSPVQVAGSLAFSQLATAFSSNGDHWSLGTTTAGVAYGWGGNSRGQLGSNDTLSYSSPHLVVGSLTITGMLPTGGADSVPYSIAYGSNGQVYAWGDNSLGQLGTGSASPTGVSSPVLVVGGLGLKGAVPSASNTFSVTPGTSYTLNMLQALPTFNGSLIGNGYGTPTSVTLYFEE